MYKIVAGFHTGFVFGRGKNQSCKTHCSWRCLGICSSRKFSKCEVASGPRKLVDEMLISLKSRGGGYPPPSSPPKLAI